MHRMIVAVAALLLAACASTGSKTADSVRDADPATVNRDCKLLGTVEARSVFGGSDTARFEGAKTAAREKAAAMGATDVLFIKVDNSGMFNTGYATARAYRCDAKN